MLLPIDDLLSRVSDAVWNLPGAVELYLFGSAADPIHRDEYSDLDLQIVAEPYSLSRQFWPFFLTQVGEIELAYPISEQPFESAFCIEFTGESLYHKVDIGICERQNPSSFFHKIENKKLLWQKTTCTDLTPISSCEAFVPQPGTAAHFLVGELISAVRYVKARKRSQHLTCWRFLSAKFNALLRCHQWEGNLNYFPSGALNTWDYASLDRLLPESERQCLLESIDTHSPKGMDLVLIQLTHKIINTISLKYSFEDKRIGNLIRKYIYFIENELEIPV
ncbi:MAG: hypothetical protein IH586_08880 [Anaerolineaceae bacterium]|nr:hypothetical protein [Anaerolineaceae bacterium]